MNVLVLNAGSSSLKFKVINTAEGTVLQKGHVDGIGLSTCKFILGDNIRDCEVSDHDHAVQLVLDSIDVSSLEAVGHRVVHGGDAYNDAVRLNEEVIAEIERLSPLAPLHNPVNLSGIHACRRLLPEIPQVAVFDTAFHQTIPSEAFLYAIPYEMYEKYRLRKYGFHGTSHKFLSMRAAKLLEKENANVITCHLGNGSSVAAVKDGVSIDTSMGMTPLPGLVMGTRCGDIDPEIIPYLMEHEGKDVKEVMHILNKQSGLAGLSGDSDVRALHARSKKGDAQAILALDILAYHVARYIGAYMAIMGEPTDALVFSGGIGEGGWYIREAVCRRIEHMGVVLDTEQNSKNMHEIVSRPESPVKVYVISTDEELMIARDTERGIM